MRESPIVKICGLQRREDALLADELGADLLGVVLTEGFSRSVGLPLARELVTGVRARRVAVLVDESVDRAREKAEALEADVIQLHGTETPATVEALARSGSWLVWKGIRARTPEDVVKSVGEYGGLVDGFLVEGWKEGVVGGGGVALALPGDDVRACLPSDATFILAGGLTPGTVAAAVRRFRPDVVDVSSGVESEPGRKDPELMTTFIEAMDAARSRAGAPTPRSEAMP